MKQRNQLFFVLSIWHNTHHAFDMKACQRCTLSYEWKQRIRRNAALLRLIPYIDLNKHRHPKISLFCSPINLLGQFHAVKRLNLRDFVYYIPNFINLQPPNKIKFQAGIHISIFLKDFLRTILPNAPDGGPKHLIDPICRYRFGYRDNLRGMLPTCRCLLNAFLNGLNSLNNGHDCPHCKIWTGFPWSSGDPLSTGRTKT